MQTASEKAESCWWAIPEAKAPESQTQTGNPRKSSFLPDKAFLASKKLDIS